MAAFMKYEGIDGESKDAEHRNWIDVLSLSWGVHGPEGGSTGPSRRRGAPQIDDMVVTVEYDKAAPKLLEKSLKGSVVPKLEIELTATYGGARATYLRYELTNVLISSYQTNASGNDEVGPPIVVVGNSFEAIKVTYTEFDAAGSSLGSVETSYKVKETSKKTKKRKK